MPRVTRQLSVKEIDKLIRDVTLGKHAVGGVPGLLLQIKSEHAASWVLRAQVGNKRKEIGLGSYSTLKLKDAKEKALNFRQQIENGIDPVNTRKAAKSKLIAEQESFKTFEDIAKEFIEKKSKEYKTAKQTQKLESMLKNYAYPHLGKMSVKDIQIVHIENTLTPIWETKTETATRLRIYIEGILNLAIVKGLRHELNPARWKGNLDQVLAKPEKVNKVQNYKALPVDELPNFMKELVQQDWMGAKALTFAILTAARSVEVRAATWDEINLEEKLWTLPEERMKGGKKHIVPLSEQAIQLLNSLDRNYKYLFPNTKGNALTDATISKVPKRLDRDVTAHGFRSTFKDWARIHTDFADEVSELALAHVSSDATRAAYARDGLVDKRREMMRDWAEYCFKQQISN